MENFSTACGQIGFQNDEIAITVACESDDERENNEYLC